MLNGVLLIIVTMFAVLGAYYLAEVISQLCAKKKLENTVLVTLATQQHSLCETVMLARDALPQCEIIAICSDDSADKCETLQASMRGVHFVKCSEAGECICDLLAVRSK